MSGANIELYCASEQFLSIDDCMDFWRDVGFPFAPMETVTLEAWPWEGEQRQSPPALDVIEELIKGGKIVFLYGEAGGGEAGILMTKEGGETSRFTTEFWLRESMVSDLERFYDRAEQSLTRFEPHGLLLAGIGVETYIKEDCTIEATMAQSHVARWLYPPKKGLPTPPHKNPEKGAAL